MMSIRDFNHDNEEDYLFTYEILLKRYSSSISIIQGITPKKTPSYEEHKKNIKNRFPIMKIALINNFPVGLGYIDKENTVGFFYHFVRLKNALKTINNKNLDFSEYFLKTILSFAKNKTLHAKVSINNKLANKTASRLMNFVISTSAYNLYSYRNE